MLKIVDRLILLELRSPLLFGIGMFSLLVIATVVLQEAARFVIRYSLPVDVFLRMVLLASPQFIMLAIPMGVLLGTLIAVGHLSASLEITAMRACGVSLWRVLMPFFLVGVLMSGITFFGAERLVPQSNTHLKNLKNDILSGKGHAVRQERLDFPVYEKEQLRWLLMAGTVEGSKLIDVKLFYFDARDPNADFWVSAERAEWSGNNWLFYNMRSIMLRPEDEPAVFYAEKADVEGFNVNPESLALRSTTAEDLTIVQLKQAIDGYLASGEFLPGSKEILDFRTKLYFKYTIPLTPLFFVLIAVPLGISRQRTSTQVGMGIALLVVLGYYVLYTACLKLGAVGALPPPVAAWLPNTLLLGVGIWTMQNRERN